MISNAGAPSAAANPLLPKLLPARQIPLRAQYWGPVRRPDQPLCVELWRIELQTSSMPWKRSTN